MAQAETIPTTSRRGFLAALGFASAAAGVGVRARADEPKESGGHFGHPAEYLAAMQAIGWRPLAMFERLEDGSIHRLGVNDSGPDEETIMKNWSKFHAISLRVPVQISGSQGEWWQRVWHHLYDSGLREDLSRPSA